MEPDDLEVRLRERESFRALLIDTEAWTIIRLDGRAFTRFTAGRFAKPFDERLRNHMLEAATALLHDFQGLYAYIFSDEISLLLPPGVQLFSGRVEKLLSVSAGVVSAAFTHSCGVAAHFDSRIWQSQLRREVLDYFRWRQIDAARCALNAWCYWTLREHGAAVETAVKQLAHQDKHHQRALLQQHGIDYRQIPLWQRHGVGLYWQRIEKPGYDPIRQQSVISQRREARRNLELPDGEEYSRYLNELLGHDDQ